jgi:hypothetical protein
LSEGGTALGAAVATGAGSGATSLVTAIVTVANVDGRTALVAGEVVVGIVEGVKVASVVV